MRSGTGVSHIARLRTFAQTLLPYRHGRLLHHVSQPAYLASNTWHRNTSVIPYPRGYNGTVRVLGIDVGVAADILAVDLDEELLLFLQARDVSLSECRLCINCGVGVG